MIQTPCGRLMMLLLVGALGVPVAATANQSQPGPWWKSADVQKELGLTPDQVMKIDTIWESTRPEMVQEREELDRFETRLSKMIASNRDEADVARQIDRVETARASLNKTRSLMLYRMRQALSEEQNKKFQVLQERWQQQNAGRSQPPAGSRPPGAAPPKNGGGPDGQKQNPDGSKQKK
jgi:Spy/CpxP family protein refolding chaperone